MPAHSHRRIFHDSGHADNPVPPDDDGPPRPLAAWHLGVGEDVLQLLAATGETVAGLPRAHLEARFVGLDLPRAEADGTVLERDPIVLADGSDPPPEVALLRALARCEETEERLLHVPREAGRLLPGGAQGLVGSGVEA